MIKKILIALLIALCVGCSSDPASNIVLQRNDVVVLPRPNSIQLDKVLFSSASVEGSQYFTLTPAYYQTLSINIHKIMAYSKDADSIIKQYELMIKDSNKQLNNK